MRKRLWLKIYGNVQGVGFRYSAARKAQGLGLKGWVRNCNDGCVEIEAEGEESVVEAYRKWCKKGPMFSKVERLEEEWREAKGYKEFEIR